MSPAFHDRASLSLATDRLTTTAKACRRIGTAYPGNPGTVIAIPYHNPSLSPPPSGNCFVSLGLEGVTIVNEKEIMEHFDEIGQVM